MKSVILWLCWLQTSAAFNFPTSMSSDVAPYARISSTSNCSDSSCSLPCAARSDFPFYYNVLSYSNCSRIPTTVGMPSHINVTNGAVTLNSSESCEVLKKNNNPHFTLSFWLKASSMSNVTFLSVGNIFLDYVWKNLYLRTGSVTISTLADANVWHAVLLQYNGQLSLTVDSSKPQNISWSSITGSIDLNIGKNLNLTNSDSIQLADIRWYQDALTDREVKNIVNGNFQALDLLSECRCPATHPTLVENTLPKKYMKCTNGNDEVPRLSPDAHLAEYMIDNNATTSWRSSTVNAVSITLTFAKVYQMKTIVIEGITTNVPDTILVKLVSDTVSTVKVCPTALNTCSQLIMPGRLSFEFEGSISSRADYESITAKTMEITFYSSSAKNYTVSEIKLSARCACYGNNDQCRITNGYYTCMCGPSTNTTGEYCQTCQPKYFTDTSEAGGGFQCDHMCNCNLTGGNNETCQPLNGQCSCKVNVEGRQCDRCKHNTADFSSAGCRNCACNPVGITSCLDGRECQCKQNVDNSTGKCNECLTNFYNISDPVGCTACGCDETGTVVGKENTCDAQTGRCECRAHVQGRSCNECLDGYYNFTLVTDADDVCDNCSCNLVGSVQRECNKVTGQCPCFDGSSPNRKCVPEVMGFDPEYGPIAGGTLLTVSGILLGQSGAVINLTIGGISQQVVNQSTNTSVVFRTFNTTSIGKKDANFSVTVRGQVFYNTKTFEYRTNPQVLVNDKIKSFASGGCSEQFKGQYLNGVKYPKMLTVVDGINLESPCERDSQKPEELMTCLTANVSTFTITSPLPAHIKFDDILSAKYSVEIVPDPQIEKYQRAVFKNTFDDVFTIKGSGLNGACRDNDVTVKLGDKVCTLMERTNSSIKCDPREAFPGETRTVTVSVKIGNLEMVWGQLEIKSFWDLKEFIYIVVGIGGPIIIIVVVVIAWCCVRRGKCQRKSESEESLQMDHIGHSRRNKNDYIFTNPMANTVAVIPPLDAERKERTSKEIADDFCNRLEKSVKKVVNTSLIERCNIDIPKNCTCTHKGKLIRVINGQYNSNSSSPYSGMALTIKTLVAPYPEEGDLPQWLSEGLLECTRLRDFIDDNVLRMNGIAIDAKQLYIIYPEMSNRTLKDYILQHEQDLGAEKSLEICVQVAEGMNYLSNQGIVHKDLAARNCWVARDKKVKIGDASFSFDLYPKEYYENNGKFQPVRWMAPECLRQGFYDTKSDVWAYGVLIWEVYTPGYLPYYDISNDKDVLTKVCDHGYRLGKPHGCPNKLFAITEECHQRNGRDRPEFGSIQNKLDNIVHPDRTVRVAYVNDSTLEVYANTPERARGLSNESSTDAGLEDYENAPDQMELYENTKFNKRR